MSNYTTSISSGTMTVTVPNVRRDNLPFFNVSAALALASVTVAVQFKDSSGNEVDCVSVNLSDDGSVCCRPSGASDADAQTLYLIKGGWHNVRISKFFVSNTDTGIGVKARFLP